MNTNKGSIVKQSSNDVEGCRSQSILFQPNMRTFLQYSVRLLFVLATEHTLLRIFFYYWCQIWLPGDLHDAAFQNFFTIECETFNCQRGLLLLARLSNPGVLLFNNRAYLTSLFISVYSQCALCNRTWLKFRKAFCLF